MSDQTDTAKLIIGMVNPPTLAELQVIQNEGCRAFESDGDNPYQWGTWRYSAWKDGNDEAFESYCGVIFGDGGG